MYILRGYRGKADRKITRADRPVHKHFKIPHIIRGACRVVIMMRFVIQLLHGIAFGGDSVLKDQPLRSAVLLLVEHDAEQAVLDMVPP